MTSAACVFLLVAVGLYSRRHQALIADSDFAVTELHTELASRFDLLAGPYSRYNWNHPGPLYSYVQAPFYVAGGRHAASLFAVALLINLAAVTLIAWCAWRSDSPLLAVLLTLACLLLAWKAPRLLGSPWTGHIPLLVSLAFTVMCAAVVAGRTRWLPAAIAAGTFAVQTHLSFGPMVGALALITVCAAARSRHTERTVRRTMLALASLTAAILWSPPLIDMAINRGGNMRALWHFFVAAGGDAISWRDAFAAWSRGLTTVLQPVAALPWGGHLAPQPNTWMAPVAIAQVAGLVAAAILERRAGRPFESALAACACTAAAIGLWATARITGPVRDHQIFWLAGIGAVNIAIVAATVVRRLPLPRAGPLAPAVTLVLVWLAVAAVGVQHLRGITSFETRRTTPRRIPLAHRAIVDYMRLHGVTKPLIEMDAASWSQGAGIVLRLHQDGIPLAVAAPLLPMFTNRFAATGDEDALVTISPRYGYHYEKQARPGNVTLLESEPVFVNAIKTAARRR